MVRASFVLLIVGMLALLITGIVILAVGRHASTHRAPTYSVEQALTELRTNPHSWIGRTIVVRGVALQAPGIGLVLVDAHLAATIPQDLAGKAVTAWIIIEGRINSPILYLRSRHASRYGRDLKPHAYKVLLHPIPCRTTLPCDEGELLDP